MSKPHWSERLSKLRACPEAVEWARTKPSFSNAWETCGRGDWMLWLAARADVDRKLVVLAACACARLSLRHVPKGESRPRVAIETAEAWARGKATIEEVRAAAAAAAATYAAYAAAADAAAADAAAAAAAAAAYAAARRRTLKECAVLVRKTISARKVSAAWRKR